MLELVSVLCSFFRVHVCLYVCMCMCIDYLSPGPRSANADDDDGHPTRYGFYLYEQVYGAIYPPTPSTREYFNLDGWISTIYPEAAVCGPVASIGFGV